MTQYKIVVKNEAGTIKAETSDESQIVMSYEGNYEPGDRIGLTVPEVPAYYMIRLDDCMDEALVYLTRPEVEFVIPFDEKKIAYNPKAFTGDRHYLALRMAYEWEAKSYRNLAKNVMDQHGDHGCYPHASANVETRGESVFAARNAIDGVLANDSHGAWPYQSWGINQQDDAEIIVDFGRKVTIDTVILYTRADFPHDNWWEEVTLSFSDGSEEIVSMEKSSKPHIFHINRSDITWIKMSEMIKADDPSPFPALTQIEVYGS